MLFCERFIDSSLKFQRLVSLKRLSLGMNICHEQCLRDKNTKAKDFYLMSNKNAQHLDSLYKKFLIIPLILLLSGCSMPGRNKEATQTQYRLDTNLIVDERPLEPRSLIISADQGATLYFEDAEKSRVYKVFYLVKPGEQEGEVEILTGVHAEVMAPSFLTYEGQEASYTASPPELPIIEVQVKASPVKPAHP